MSGLHTAFIDYGSFFDGRGSQEKKEVQCRSCFNPAFHTGGKILLMTISSLSCLFKSSKIIIIFYCCSVQHSTVNRDPCKKYMAFQIFIDTVFLVSLGYKINCGNFVNEVNSSYLEKKADCSIFIFKKTDNICA